VRLVICVVLVHFTALFIALIILLRMIGWLVSIESESMWGGSGSYLILVTIPKYVWRVWGKPRTASIKIFYFRAETWTGDLPNKKERFSTRYRNVWLPCCSCSMSFEPWRYAVWAVDGAVHGSVVTHASYTLAPCRTLNTWWWYKHFGWAPSKRLSVSRCPKFPILCVIRNILTATQTSLVS
jgi:hypothetical protein